MFKEIILSLSEQVATIALENSVSISFAESCTGGLLSKIITDRAGSSFYFKGGIVAYHNNIKEEVLGVSSEVLTRFGAVSEETALDMARGALKLMKTDFCGSVTGIAGPDGGSIDKPVGTVWFCVTSLQKTITDIQRFEGNREFVRYKTAIHLLEMLINIMTEAR